MAMTKWKTVWKDIIWSWDRMWKTFQRGGNREFSARKIIKEIIQENLPKLKDLLLNIEY